MTEKKLTQNNNDIVTREQTKREKDQQLEGLELPALGVDDSAGEQA